MKNEKSWKNYLKKNKTSPLFKNPRKRLSNALRYYKEMGTTFWKTDSKVEGGWNDVSSLDGDHIRKGILWDGNKAVTFM